MRGDRLAGLHETEIGEYLAALLGCHGLLAGLTRADFTGFRRETKTIRFRSVETAGCGEVMTCASPDSGFSVRGPRRQHWPSSSSLLVYKGEALAASISGRRESLCPLPLQQEQPEPRSATVRVSDWHPSPQLTL